MVNSKTKKEKLNRIISYIEKATIMLVVFFSLFIYAVAIIYRNYLNITTIENLDPNRFLSDITLFFRTMFDMSQGLSAIFAIAHVVLIFVLIYTCIYICIKKTALVANDTEKKYVKSENTSYKHFKKTYLIQERFLC